MKLTYLKPNKYFKRCELRIAMNTAEEKKNSPKRNYLNVQRLHERVACWYVTANYKTLSPNGQLRKHFALKS